MENQHEDSVHVARHILCVVCHYDTCHSASRGEIQVLGACVGNDSSSVECRVSNSFRLVPTSSSLDTGLVMPSYSI